MQALWTPSRLPISSVAACISRSGSPSESARSPSLATTSCWSTECCSSTSARLRLVMSKRTPCQTGTPCSSASSTASSSTQTISPSRRAHPVLDRRRLAAAEQRLVFDRQRPLAVVGVQQPRPEARVGEELLGAVAEDLLDLGADVAPAALLAELGGVDDHRQPLDHPAVVLSAAAGDLVEELADLVVWPVALAGLAHRGGIDRSGRCLNLEPRGTGSFAADPSARHTRHDLYVDDRGRVRLVREPAKRRIGAVAPGDRAVKAAEGEGADEAAVGLVGGVELFDLGDRRAAAEPGEVADQLDVAEVAGRQRVHLAAAEEGQALDRPGADFGGRQQAPVAVGVGRVAAAGDDVAGEPPQRRRAAGGEVHRLQFGRGAAGDRRRRRRVARGARAVAEAGAPAADDAAFDQRRPRGLDQLLDDRRGERLPGPGRRAAAGSAGSGGSAAPQQRVAAEAAVEGDEVVVDPEREAHPLDRGAELGAVGGGRLGAPRRRGGSRGRRARSAAAPADRLGPQQRRGRRRAARRGPGPARPRRGAAAARPRLRPAGCRRWSRAPSRYGEAGRTSTSSEPAPQPPSRPLPAEQVDVDQEGAAGDDLLRPFAAAQATAARRPGAASRRRRRRAPRRRWRRRR